MYFKDCKMKKFKLIYLYPLLWDSISSEHECLRKWFRCNQKPTKSQTMALRYFSLKVAKYARLIKEAKS